MYDDTCTIWPAVPHGADIVVQAGWPITKAAARPCVCVQASDAEVCSICFEQACSIEVRECGHQMCAACTLALCCHAKPNPATQSQPLPACPFCRGGIARLVVATRARAGDEEEGSRLESPRHRRSRRSTNLSGDAGSTSSLMGSIASSIGKMGRRRTDSSEQVDDKP